jgi:hypothetical protein
VAVRSPTYSGTQPGCTCHNHRFKLHTGHTHLHRWSSSRCCSSRPRQVAVQSPTHSGTQPGCTCHNHRFKLHTGHTHLHRWSSSRCCLSRPPGGGTITPPGPLRSPCLAYSSANRSLRAVADASAAAVGGPDPAKGDALRCRLLLLLLLGVLRPGVPGGLLLGTELYLQVRRSQSSRSDAVQMYFGMCRGTPAILYVPAQRQTKLVMA